MTNPFRNRNRQSGKPFQEPKRRGKDRLDKYDDDEQNLETKGASRSSSRSPEGAPGNIVKAEIAYAAADSKRRAIALIIDIIIAFMLGTVLQAVSAMIGVLVPGFGSVFSLQMIMLVILLLRDSLYQGRGIGKNLMGLQVMDSATAKPITMMQGLRRNIIFFIPFIVLQLVNSTLLFLPFGGEMNAFITSIIYLGCMIYIILIFPFEGYFTFKSKDGRRIGDQMAGSVVQDSQMDFSTPFGKEE
ncbi:MAG: RDD family protein [Candidatus Obscuribacterales bacterium]|nr:RDD family protein [Candidatus Obscuribacterales bacterium]